MNAKENSTAPTAKSTNTPNAPNAKLYGKIVLTLQNCLLPDEKLNSTPSHLDGLDAETETDLRILGCELIQTAGILLKLPQVSLFSRANIIGTQSPDSNLLNLESQRPNLISKCGLLS